MTTLNDDALRRIGNALKLASAPPAEMRDDNTFLLAALAVTAIYAEEILASLPPETGNESSSE